MTVNILEARGLCYDYPDGTRALDHINLLIQEGSRTAILGANGAGKSTLFLHFNGIFQPTKGTMKYRGQDYKYQRRYLQQLKQRVGIVFQNPEYQLFSASVRQDISFGLLNMGYSSREAREKVNLMGEQMGINYLFDRPTHFLSAGQKKLVSLAGVMVMNPDLLVCDEPSAGLDPANTERFMKVIEKIQQQGSTVVISTHDVNLAYSWADQIYILDQGQVRAGGKPEQVLADKDTLAICGMQQPWILECWEELKTRADSSPSAPPRTKEELFQLGDRDLIGKSLV